MVPGQSGRYKNSGDVVTKVGETTVNSASELQEQDWSFRSRDKVNLTFESLIALKKLSGCTSLITVVVNVLNDTKQQCQHDGAEFGEIDR